MWRTNSIVITALLIIGMWSCAVGGAVVGVKSVADHINHVIEGLIQ